MKNINLILLLVSIFIGGCQKWEQQEETQIVCHVLDITTGKMSEKAHISLIEIETPSKPFSSLVRTVVNEFEVNYNESFSYSFNARRGDRFDYYLEFQYNDGNFGSSTVTDGFAYSMDGEALIQKGQSMEYELRAVPRTHLNLYLNNPPDVGSTSEDSIWVEFFDGFVKETLTFKGLGSAPVRRSEIPHGNYTYTYEIYKGDSLMDTHTADVYFKFDSDTSIVIDF
jgi:hypothetical protein